MRELNFTEEQILAILKEHQSGVSVTRICRKYAISDSIFYKWKIRYLGPADPEVSRIRQLELKLSRLKRMYAEIVVENFALKDSIANKSRYNY